MNAILGWAQLISRGRVTGAEAQRGLAVIERNARAQGRLVDDMLDVSRITSGKLHLETSRVQLDEVARVAVESLLPLATEKGVALGCRVEPGAYCVLGDSDRLDQVLKNLLTNAIKFTPAGGSVSVTLRPSDRCIEASVEDTGIAIEPGALTEIFERYHQVESGTSRGHGGLGLGLAIVKHLVEAHGGSVRAESAGSRRGSRFVVLLPSFHEGEQDGRSAAADARATLQGKRILVVDGDPEERDKVQSDLAASGARVEAVSSPTTARDRLSEGHFDLLVCAFVPDTFAGMCELRRSAADATSDMPALAVSGRCSTVGREQVLAAGFDAHVAKPVLAEDLCAAAARLLRLAGDARR